jgi:hypothetical protein
MERVPDSVVAELVAERLICRRAQRVWRIASVVAAVGLGLVTIWLGAIAFGFCQFLCFATRWHSVRDMEARTGLTESAQLFVLSQFDARSREATTR